MNELKTNCDSSDHLICFVVLHEWSWKLTEGKLAQNTACFTVNSDHFWGSKCPPRMKELCVALTEQHVGSRNGHSNSLARLSRGILLYTFRNQYGDICHSFIVAGLKSEPDECHHSSGSTETGRLGLSAYSRRLGLSAYSRRLGLSAYNLFLNTTINHRRKDVACRTFCDRHAHACFHQ